MKVAPAVAEVLGVVDDATGSHTEGYGEVLSVAHAAAAPAAPRPAEMERGPAAADEATRDAVSCPQRIIDSGLVLVRQGSPGVLRFDQFQALQAGMAAPLTCHASHPGIGIGTKYPKARNFGRWPQWLYNESKCVAAQDACRVQLVWCGQGTFIKLVDAQHFKAYSMSRCVHLVLCVAFSKCEAGAAVNWVSDEFDDQTDLMMADDGWQVNEDGSISLAKHPELCLGLVDTNRDGLLSTDDVSGAPQCPPGLSAIAQRSIRRREKNTAIVQRNKNPKADVVQFRIGDSIGSFPHPPQKGDGNLTQFWLAHDGLSHSEVPPQLAGRCSLQQWQTLIAEVDSAAAYRCNVCVWCLLGGIWCLPPAVLYCLCLTNIAQRGFHAAANKFARETGLEVAILKFPRDICHVCEPGSGPRPHLLSFYEAGADPSSEIHGKGTWVFQIIRRN